MRIEFEPFHVAWPLDDLVDLKGRLDRTRWPDAVVEDWSYGTQPLALRRLIDRWRTDYDIEGRLRAINRLPHRRAIIGGFGIHFLHFQRSGRQSRALVLLNGWPSTFLEFGRLIPLLGEYDLVVPATPGFGYSDRPTRPWQVDPSILFHELMNGLGYARYGIVATDIGVGIAMRMAMSDPDSVDGMVLSSVPVLPATNFAAPHSAAEEAFLTQATAWNQQEGAYQAVQITRPQSLAYGLTDSPAGMAGWLLEKYTSWSDNGGDVFSAFAIDDLIDVFNIYWMTGTMASSLRYYRDVAVWRAPLPEGSRINVPTTLAFGPRDLAAPPREWAERLFNVTRFSPLSRGGHFPAWEVPELYAAEIQASFSFAD